MIFKAADYHGKLRDYQLVLYPRELEIKAKDHDLLPQKFVTYANEQMIPFLEKIVKWKVQRPINDIILVIRNEDMYKFYFKLLHLNFSFAFSYHFLKKPEGWNYYQSFGAPTDGLITRTIKVWANGQGD